MSTVYDVKAPLFAIPSTDIADAHFDAELDALRKQAILDRQSREASQVEFARLNRELNEAKDRIQVLLDEIADTAIAAGMMDPGQRRDIDGPNAIQFLRHMKERYEAHHD